MMAEREMNLNEYIEQLPECHAARKQYKTLISESAAVFNEQGMNDRVHSNIEMQRDIAFECLKWIHQLAEQATRIHPEYPDSFPPILEVLRGNTELRARLARAVDACEDVSNKLKRLTEACYPIMEASAHQEPWYEMDPEWNLDAHIEITMTVAELRVIARACGLPIGRHVFPEEMRRWKAEGVGDGE